MSPKRPALILLQFLIMLQLAAAASPLVSCSRNCGNITIPYPFGIETGCYREGFDLVCNDMYSPPKLFILGFDQEVIDISLDRGEVRVYSEASRSCSSNTNDGTGGYPQMSAGDDKPYLFSTRNKYTAIGCPNLGYFVDNSGYYVSGCMSICRPSTYALDVSCTGVGCCQSSIPTGVNHYEPSLLRTPNDTNGGAFIFQDNSTPCTYGFLVDEDWFQFNTSYRSMTKDFNVPVVLDWAIRTPPNCTTARLNATTFACRSTYSFCNETVDLAMGPVQAGSGSVPD